MINEYEFSYEEPEIEFPTFLGSHNKSIAAVGLTEGLALMRQNNILEDSKEAKGHLSRATRVR